MAIEIKKKDNKVILIYAPDGGDTSFIEESFNGKGFFQLKRVFVFQKEDVMEKSNNKYIFILGKLNSEDYFVIESDILTLNNKLLIYKDVDINKKTFLGSTKQRNFSVFSKLEQFIKRDIIIGGTKQGAIPEEIFYAFLDSVPTDYEIDQYIDARYTSILSIIFEDGIEDVLGKYNIYTRKKIEILKNRINKKENIFGGELLNEYEITKYEGIKETIKTWLEAPEGQYSESDWQHLVKNIICLLFPKYIAVFEEAPVEDPYTKTKKGKNTTREMDYLLVDADGNCDIAEIKLPFEHCILSKDLYRDNYVPKRELSGAIMQVEKYIFYMNKKGMDADKKLNDKYKNMLPPNFEIKVTNPKGLVILGRTKNFDEKQKRDYEIIKRKYHHIMDILSYDDILNRLENMITMLKAKKNNSINHVVGHSSV